MSRPPPRRWLILSHAFNMDGRASSLTITDKMPHLMAAGIEPIVLSSVGGSADTRFVHERLLPWGPAGLRFELRHVLARRWGRGPAYRVFTLMASLLLALPIALERLALGLRNHWSWALPAYVRARRWLARGDIDLVYTTGGAYSAHLAGYWLKRHTGCHWIVEVHDPLVQPGVPPRDRNERFMARLEARICRHADLAWWFTEGALASARARHPELGDRGLMVLPGADPPLRHAQHSRGPHCVFAHFGSLSPTRSLAPALQGLADWLVRRPDARPRVRVEVYGSELDPEARCCIDDRGLQDVVLVAGRLEHDPATGRSGRERVVERMQQVDVLLMMHGLVPDCAEYIPSKLYDYFWARRPVLALSWRNPQLDALVREHGGTAVATDDPVAIATAFEALFESWSADRLSDVRIPPVTVESAVHRIVAAVDRDRAPRP